MSAPVLTRPVYDCSAKSILTRNGVSPNFHYSFSRSCGGHYLDISLAVTDCAAATCGVIKLQLMLPNGDTTIETVEVSHETPVARARFSLSDAQYYLMLDTKPDVRPLVISSQRSGS